MLPDPPVAIALSALTLLAQDAAPQLDLFGRILNNPLTPLVGLFLLFYFIFILPERRRKSNEGKMMSALKKNDRIVTIGGMHGTIVSAPKDGDVITVRIDEGSNTRVKFNRSAISRILADKETAITADKETGSDTNDKE